MMNLERQAVCRRKVDGQRTRVPGDRGETDLAEEERAVLSQLGVEAATKIVMMVRMLV